VPVNDNLRMGMTPQMRAELLTDLASLLPGAADWRSRSLSPSCSTCRYFRYTHRSKRNRNAWGKCRRFGTTVGRYGKACEEYVPLR